MKLNKFSCHKNNNILMKKKLTKIISIITVLNFEDNLENIFAFFLQEILTILRISKLSYIFVNYF